MSELGETWSRTCTRAGGASLAASSRLPGLTVLYHPDLERIGERALLTGLDGAGAELSRGRPDFAAVGGSSSRPLDDPGLSRTPLRVRSAGDRLVIERGASRLRAARVVDDALVEIGASSSVDAEALDEGVVLLLGGRVVLLLHRLDPVVDPATPRFGLVGESSALAEVRRDIVQVADLDVPVLLLGASGTGKELVARALHQAGARAHGPFVALNMAALPPTLAAAELFGAEKGAYTGAARRRRGHFEQADGGTLFLDEVGDTPADVQALLLRVLETGRLRRVGGEETRAVDVRVVSATDADLEAAIESGSFRAPLLHRLGGYVIRLPPLRARRDDFGRLVRHVLRRELEAIGALDRLEPRRHPWLPASLVARLAAWHWPGNVRQLANVVRQLVIANRGHDPAARFGEIEALLARSVPGRSDRPTTPASEPATDADTAAATDTAAVTDTDIDADPGGARKPSALREAEVVAALRAHRYRPAAAADALGIPRSSIYALIDKIPGLRKAAELTAAEIRTARDRVGPSLEAVAAALEVSELALRRRIGELGLDL
ncbi:MAG: sigma 54-interacting transcriptional regulator [Acidobacteriota bacterium]